MKYCRHCGGSLMENTQFCPYCGQLTGRFPAKQKPSDVYVEPLDKLSCELAYSGTLFWMPLLLCSKRGDARYHANQGLWLLILSVLFCTMIRLLSGINRIFAGSLFGAVSSVIYALAFTVFLFVMLYLAANALKQAMAIHNGQKLEPILFFDMVKLIMR